MNVGPKTMIAAILLFSFLIMAILVGVLGLDFFVVATIFLFLWLFLVIGFNLMILPMYRDIWNLFWHKKDGYGWLWRKWRDGYFSGRVVPLPKDNKIWFEYTEKDADGNTVNRKEVCFVPFIEIDANSGSGVIIAKQGVAESINLSSTSFCKNCGYVPFDADHATQLITDELHERETIGKLSMLGKFLGKEEKRGLGNVIFIIIVVLLIVVIYLIWENHETVLSLKDAVNALVSSISTGQQNVVVTPG